MELEELHVLRDDVGRRAVLLIAPKLIVDLHDVGQFVGQVILGEESAVTTQLHEHSHLSVPTPPRGRAALSFQLQELLHELEPP